MKTVNLYLSNDGFRGLPEIGSSDENVVVEQIFSMVRFPLYKPCYQTEVASVLDQLVAFESQLAVSLQESK